MPAARAAVGQVKKSADLAEVKGGARAGEYDRGAGGSWGCERTVVGVMAAAVWAVVRENGDGGGAAGISK